MSVIFAPVRNITLPTRIFSIFHTAIWTITLAAALLPPRDAAAQHERRNAGGERARVNAREQNQNQRYQNQQGGAHSGGERGGARGGEGGGPGPGRGGATPQPTPFIGKPYLLPIATTPTSSPMTFVIPAVDMPKPIGIGSTSAEASDFITKHLHSGDLTFVAPPEGGGALDPVTSTTRCVILRATDFDQAGPLIQWAKQSGVREIAFNADGATIQEIVDRQRKLFTMTHAAGLSFTFAPKVTDLESHAREFAPYADTIVIQSQRYQGSFDYAETVRKLIGQVKDANPQVKVWVQVSVNPPYAPKIAGQRVVEQVMEIAARADGVFIFYSPQRWEMTKRVLEALRPLAYVPGMANTEEKREVSQAEGLGEGKTEAVKEKKAGGKKAERKGGKKGKKGAAGAEEATETAPEEPKSE